MQSIDLSQLNSAQQQAVLASDKHLMIIAGPGTGKTKTLISKLAYLLLEQKVEPPKIVALTFTNKAAGEIKERLQNLLPKQKNLPFVGTFHALALHFLSQKKAINLISQTKHWQIIHQILADYYAQTKQKLDQQTFELQLSKFKNLSLSVKELAPEILLLIKKYNQNLKQLGLLDYDDLLLEFLTFLDQFPLRYKYLLIDEYQDINSLQYQIIKKLLADGQLVVIGDPKQAIYAFRGATPQAFADFKQDFPTATTIYLSTNYRSSQSIIDLAAGLFPKEQKLIAFAKQPTNLQLIKTLNQFSEATWILKKIEELTGGTNLIQASEHHGVKTNLRFKDFAIIYRTHHISKAIEEKFYNEGIPYQQVGVDHLFAQPLISQLIEVVQLLNSPLAKSELSENKEWQVFFTNLTADKKLALLNLPLTALFKKLVDLLGLNLKIKKPRLEKQFYQLLSFLPQFETASQPLADFLNFVAKLEENNFYDDQADKVTLLTMHAAKGLEFNTVFVCGFEEGSIPLHRKVLNTNLAEEKRLLYVALTRAKQNLYLLYSKKRFSQLVKLSSFAANLDLDLLEQIEDPFLEKLAKKKEKNRLKKSQLTLF